METTPQILVVGNDSLLRGEFETACQSLRKWRPVLHFATHMRAAVETARTRRPEIVCVQMESDPRALRTFADEIHAVAPEASVIALYRPGSLGAGDSEGAVLIDAIRAHVQDFLRRPLVVTELQGALDRLLVRTDEPRRKLGRVVSIVSNKGGVGKSTLSVSLACELARRNKGKVLLVDASLHLGSCAPMLDLNPQTTLASAAREMSRLDETLLKKLTVTHECGLDLLAAPVDAVEAADIDDQAIARVLTLARRSYDWVVVDTFPMLDGLVMAILDLSDRAYVITQNTVPNVVGAARLLPVMEHLGFPRDRTRIVLNNNFERISGGLTPEDAAARMDRDIDFVLPYQKRLVTALNTGRPYVLHATGLFGFAKTIRKLVDELETVGASDDTAPVREERQGGTQPSPAAKQDPLRMNPGPATA